MTRNPARYSVTYGLSGCYLPDSHLGAFEFHSARDFARFIRDEIAQSDMPKSAFGQIGFRELWAFIKKRGSSTAHFKITHEGFALSFHGLTEAEYLEAVKQEEA